jgi:hypothetical protein
MFACDYYPADEQFLDSVQKEVTHQVYIHYTVFTPGFFYLSLQRDDLFSDSTTAVPSFSACVEWK